MTTVDDLYNLWCQSEQYRRWREARLAEVRKAQHAVEPRRRGAGVTWNTTRKHR